MSRIRDGRRAVKGELRDERTRGWWWCDNETSRYWRAKLKPVNWSVYTLLLEMAGNKGSCWPSYATIAERCSISRRAAMNAVQALVEAGLVKVTERQRDGTKERTSNVYSILDSGAPDSPPSEPPAPPSAPDAPPVVNDVHPNKTQVNKTQEKDTVPSSSISRDMALEKTWHQMTYGLTFPKDVARSFPAIWPLSWTDGVLTLHVPSHLAKRRALADELCRLLTPVAPVELVEVRITNGQ